MSGSKYQILKIKYFWRNVYLISLLGLVLAFWGMYEFQHNQIISTAIGLTGLAGMWVPVSWQRPSLAPAAGKSFGSRKGSAPGILQLIISNYSHPGVKSMDLHVILKKSKVIPFE